MGSGTDSPRSWESDDSFEQFKKHEVTVTDKQKFLSLAKFYEELKTKMESTREELNTAMAKLGLGQYVQDMETLAVYKIIKPTGRYVHYSDVDYVRTALEGERAGSLSKKQAEEAGFSLKKQ